MGCDSNPEIARAAALLRAGGVVAFPTETVYGLGANALDERAVARVFEIKGRPRFDPLIVHLSGVEGVSRLAAEFPPTAQKLAEEFWPGPLTLVLPKTPAVPDLVTAGLATVALRVPDHPMAQELLRAARVPIAAPSANPFGRVSPTTADHVREQLGGQVELVLDGGPCRVGVESTVLAVTAAGVSVMRFGGTTLEDIEAVVGKVAMKPEHNPAAPSAGLASPGTLPQHYAPRTPLIVREFEATGNFAGVGTPARRVGLLAFRSPRDVAQFDRVEVLSPAGDLREAAANVFAAMHRLDAAGLDLIVAELLPEQGLGRAINDRLRRAAHA